MQRKITPALGFGVTFTAELPHKLKYIVKRQKEWFNERSLQHTNSTGGNSLQENLKKQPKQRGIGL